VIFDEEMRWD
jgi:hypothetical protein